MSFLKNIHRLDAGRTYQRDPGSLTLSRVLRSVAGSATCPSQAAIAIALASARGTVDRPRQLHQRVLHVDDRVQPRAQEIALSAIASFLRSHRHLRCANGITSSDSREFLKAKLQAFEPSHPKSLQFQTLPCPENRLLLNGLGGISWTTGLVPLVAVAVQDRKVRC